jgi:sulfate transport system substrate-binding protein
VAVVDKVVDRKGTRKVATAYLEYLYSPAGQEILAKYHYRVPNEAIAKKYAADFKPVRLVTPEQMFGSWDKIAEQHFGRDGIFERALEKAAAH